MCCLNYSDSSYIILHLSFLVFFASCLKVKYFGALAVKIVYYEHLASVVVIRFLVFFYYSLRCRPRGICLFIPCPLRFGSELDLQCRNYTFVLKLRSLPRWCVVLLVIFFERQVVKGGSDSALPCAATLSSMPARRLEKLIKDCKLLRATFVRRPDRDLVVLASPNEARIARSLIIGILIGFVIESSLSSRFGFHIDCQLYFRRNGSRYSLLSFESISL